MVVYLVTKLPDVSVKRGKIVGRLPGRAQECVSETPSAEPERLALIGQRDHDLSFVFRVS